MQISFDNQQLREICENIEEAEKTHGNSVAAKLMNRLMDLVAAKTIYDLPVGRPETYGGHPFDRYKVDLGENHILIFRANHPKNPYLENGQVDWRRVTRIKLISIETTDENI